MKVIAEDAVRQDATPALPVFRKLTIMLLLYSPEGNSGCLYLQLPQVLCLPVAQVRAGKLLHRPSGQIQ